MDVAKWMADGIFAVKVASSYVLMVAAMQDLAARSVSRLPLFLLYGLGLLLGVDVRVFGLWLLLMACGTWFERLEKVPLGEGDLYVIAGLSLFHSAFDLLTVVTLAVWVLFPITLYAIRLKIKGQPYQLPFIPALFVAHQLVLFGSVLV